MPTIFRSGPYRVYFYSFEPNEPAHVHVDQDDLSVKFWLVNVSVARNDGFASRELGVVQKLIRDHHDYFLERWNAHFGTR